MNVYDQLIQLTSHMTLADKAQFLEYLSAALRYDLDEMHPQTEAESARRRAWLATVERTAGRWPTIRLSARRRATMSSETQQGAVHRLCLSNVFARIHREFDTFIHCDS